METKAVVGLPRIWEGLSISDVGDVAKVLSLLGKKRPWLGVYLHGIAPGRGNDLYRKELN